MSNPTLNTARYNPYDDFYTLYESIEETVLQYKEYFKDRIIYCNCDDYRISNFFKFFVYNFNTLELKALHCTNYTDLRKVGSVKDSFYVEIFSVENSVLLNDSEHSIDIDALLSLGNNRITKLSGSGDFRSPECLEVLNSCDIIVTNPPFSLIHEFVDVLIKAEKQFMIIAPLTVVSSVNSSRHFVSGKFAFLPNLVSSFNLVNNEHVTLCSMGNSYWITNLPIKIEYPRFIKKYSPEEYPKLCNYDAIYVRSYKDIPVDYSGFMAVPLSYAVWHDPDKFTCIGITNRYVNEVVNQAWINSWISEIARGHSKLHDAYSPIIQVSEINKNDKSVYCVGGKYYKQLFKQLIIRRK